MGVDIGPASIQLFSTHIKDANTVVWNGPMGAFEYEPFHHATQEMAKLLNTLTLKGDLVSLVGGGDSVAAIKKLNLQDGITHVSTGGGASLELLEGKLLPGIEKLGAKN